MQVRESELVIMTMFNLMTKKSDIISSGGAHALIHEKIIKTHSIKIIYQLLKTNKTLTNRYSCAHIMFLFKDG